MLDAPKRTSGLPSAAVDGLPLRYRMWHKSIDWDSENPLANKLEVTRRMVLGVGEERARLGIQGPRAASIVARKKPHSFEGTPNSGRLVLGRRDVDSNYETEKPLKHLFARACRNLQRMDM